LSELTVDKLDTGHLTSRFRANQTAILSNVGPKINVLNALVTKPTSIISV